MSENNNDVIIPVFSESTPLLQPKKQRKNFWKSVVRNFAILCILAGCIPCAAITHIIKKSWAFLRKKQHPDAYENFATLKQVLQSKYPEDLAVLKSVYQKLKEWALKLCDYFNTEAKVWNIIKYIPILNIFYGIGRITGYIILSLKIDETDMKDKYRIEVIRSFTTILGGILALLLAGPLCSLLGVTLSATINFALEMVVGAFIQNLSVFIGEIFSTPWGELKQMTSDDWEKFINNEIFLKTPFIGTVYSYFRAIVYFQKTNPNEGFLILADGAINAIWSFGMLGACMSCHPSLSNTPLYIWLNRQLYDDCARTFTLLGKLIRNFLKYLKGYIC